MATVLKPSRPKPYTGAIDADACLNFIDNEAEYFTIVDLHRDSWVKYTAVNLESEAKAWWRSSGLKLDAKWEAFEAAFTAYHTQVNLMSSDEESDDLWQPRLERSWRKVIHAHFVNETVFEHGLYWPFHFSHWPYNGMIPLYR